MNFKYLKRSFSSLNYSFGIIGSGPGGFYTAKHLLKKYGDVQIDFYEKLPHPFGLIRTGVAPDHQEVKNIEKDFTSLLEDSRVRFLGNIQVGKDIQLDYLKEKYSALVLAYGADTENKLNLNNEDIDGCFSARSFINWYNGHLLYSKNSEFNGVNLQEAEDIIIVGNGNVAVDIARILSKSADQLKHFDIPDHVLNNLNKNKVRNIHIVARRGLFNSAFTVKEMRELSKVEGVKLNVYKNEIDELFDEKALEAILPSERRLLTRKMELIKSFNVIDPDNYNNNNKFEPNITNDNIKINIYLRFMLTPEEILLLEDNSSNKVLTGMKFKRTIDKSKQANQNDKNVKNVKNVKNDKNNQPEDYEIIKSQIIFKSIGYKSVNLFENTIKFNNDTGTLLNLHGVNFDTQNNLHNNIFCVGWAKTGPKGIVDTTLRDSYDTVESIYKAISNNLILEKNPDYENIVQMIKEKGVKSVNYKDWKKIDAFEIEEGKKRDKIREKIVDINKMLSFV